MTEINFEAASQYGQGSGELAADIKNMPRKPDGGIDWENAAKKGAGAGAAAVCTAYGAGAAAGFCAVIGQEVAGLLINGAKGLAASGTSEAEMQQMAADSAFQGLMWKQHAMLTPMMWRVLNDLYVYAQEINRPQPYEIIVNLLAGQMKLAKVTTIWVVTSESCEKPATCPPWNGKGPAPTNCQGPPTVEWCTYMGRPLGTSARPAPLTGQYDQEHYLKECLVGTCGGLKDMPRTPAPPYMAPPLDVLGPKLLSSAPDAQRQWMHSTMIGMEGWARALAVGATRASKILEKASGNPMARAARGSIAAAIPNQKFDLSAKASVSPLVVAALAAVGVGGSVGAFKDWDWRWGVGSGVAAGIVAAGIAYYLDRRKDVMYQRADANLSRLAAASQGSEHVSTVRVMTFNKGTNE